MFYFYTALHELDTADCVNVLQGLGLGKHIESFKSNQVTGVILESLTNPHFGKQIMIGLGLDNEDERHVLLTEIFRLKSGYNKVSATPQ